MAASPGRREWLSKSVSSEPEIHVIGTAATFAFLRSLISETPGDVSLIDLDIATQLAVKHDWVAELMDVTSPLLLNTDPDPVLFSRMQRSGPGGLLRSDASPKQIVRAVLAVASGLTVLDTALAPPSSDDDPVPEQLTPREAEVLRLLADGLGNKEIAGRLGISEHTIKFHIRSILAKLGASSRTEAVTRGLRSGLIEL